MSPPQAPAVPSPTGADPFHAVFENTLDALLLADDQGRYVDANPAACSLTGYAREELLQLTVADLTDPSQAPEFDTLWQAFLDQGHLEGEYALLRKDGSTRQVEFRAVASVLPHRHLSSLRDVTDQRREQIRRDAVSAVRQRVLAMTIEAGTGLDSVLEEIRRALRDAGLRFHGCGINLVDDATDPPRVRVCNLYQDQAHWADEDDPRTAAFVVDMWRRGQPLYRPDLEAEDAHDEARILVREFGARCVLDVPFSHGTLAVNSDRPHAFEPGDVALVQELAEVLSVALRRARDLQELQDERAALEERSRLLDAAARISRATASALDRDAVIDRLAEGVLAAGIFRSLSVALVDHERRAVEVVRSLQCRQAMLGDEGELGFWYEDGEWHDLPPGARKLQGSDDRWIWENEKSLGLSYPLDDANITARVARTGRLETVDEWSDHFDRRVDRPEDRQGKCAYFMPLLHGGQTLAVLATGSTLEDKEEMLRRIHTIQPLLDQAAATLHHAVLHRQAQVHATSLVRLNRQLQDQIEERRRTEADLRLERDRAQSYLDIAGVLFVALDRDGRVTLANPHACQVLGRPVDQVLGRDWFATFVPEPQRPTVVADFRRILAGDLEIAEYYENPVVTADGAECTIAWHNALVRDGAGNITGTLSAGQDITERLAHEAALEASEGRFRSLFEGSASPITLVDRDARIQLVNAAGAANLGCTPPEAEGKPFGAFMPAMHDQVLRRVRQALDEEQTLDFEDYLDLPAGPRWFLSSLQPLRGPGPFADTCLILSHDITPRKQAEARLARENELHLAESAVRMAIAEMDQPGHLRQVARELSRQLRRLGVSHERASVQVVNPDGTDFVIVGRGPDEPWPGFERLSDVEWGKPTGNAATLPWVLDTWRQQRLLHQPRGPDSVPHLAGKACVDAPYTRGTLGVSAGTGDAFAPDDIAAIARLADVLSQGCQRLDDIVARERAQRDLAREHELELAEGDLRVAIALMQSPGDLRDLLSLCSQRLADVGVPHDSLSLQVVNASGTDFISLSADASGGPEVTVNLPQPKGDGDAWWQALVARDWQDTGMAADTPWVLEVWRSGRSLCQPHVPDALDTIGGRALIDAPYSHGTLAVNSLSPHAYGPGHVALVERFARVLDDGFQRFLDLAQREQSRVELAASEARYRLLVEDLPVAVSHTTPDGQVLYHNPAQEKLYGYTLSQLQQARAPSLYVDPRQRDQFLDGLRQRGEHAYEYPMRHRDGHTVWVRGIARLVKGNTDGQDYIIGLAQDITAERNRALRQAAVSSLRQQIWHMQESADIDGIVYAVHAALTSLDLPLGACSIQVVDAAQSPPVVDTYRYLPGSEVCQRSVYLEAVPLLLDAWRGGQVRLVPDLAAADPRGERALITEVYGEVRSVLDVPFSHGLLSLNSPMTDAFSDEDVRSLEAIAEVLSDGFGRLQDLRERERHLGDLEREIAERRAAEQALRLSQQRLRHYSRRSVQATEAERRRIARELHDGVNQILSSARLHLDSAQARLARLDRQAAADVGQADNQLASAIREVRRISRDLRPGVLDDLGLGPALRSLARQVSERGCLLVDLHLDAHLPRLTAETESALYRIAQEALANASRHGRAVAVRLELTSHRDGARLSIADDGAGFDRRLVGQGGQGLGLHTMEERALLLGGTFDVRSAPGEGTTVTVTVPAAT